MPSLVEHHRAEEHQIHVPSRKVTLSGWRPLNSRPLIYTSHKIAFNIWAGDCVYWNTSSNLVLLYNCNFLMIYVNNGRWFFIVQWLFKFEFILLSSVQVRKCQYKLIKSIKYTRTIRHQGSEALTGGHVPCSYKIFKKRKNTVRTIRTMRTNKNNWMNN